MNETLRLNVEVAYRGMESAIQLELLDNEDIEGYIDMVRQHIRIAQIIIDRRLEAESGR